MLFESSLAAPKKKSRYTNVYLLFLVRPGGFEPLAFRVGAERSIQLSYDRIYQAPNHWYLISIAQPEEKIKWNLAHRETELFSGGGSPSLHPLRLRRQMRYRPSEIRVSR